MICFYVKGLEGNVSDYKEKLIFDDVVNDGYKNGMVNVAVYNSVEQTVNDEDVKKLIDKHPLRFPEQFRRPQPVSIRNGAVSKGSRPESADFVGVCDSVASGLFRQFLDIRQNVNFCQ